MGSILESEKVYIVSTDIGIMRVHVQTVKGYDVEDIVRDKAISQARAVQFSQIGKVVDPAAPTKPRTLPSIWLNNETRLIT